MKQDQKLVAEKQGKGREVKYIAKKYGTTVGLVLAVMYLIGKKGKAARSRVDIYEAIENQSE